MGALLAESRVLFDQALLDGLCEPRGSASELRAGKGEETHFADLTLGAHVGVLMTKLVGLSSKLHEVLRHLREGGGLALIYLEVEEVGKKHLVNRHLLLGRALLELESTLRHLRHLVGLELEVLGEEAEAFCDAWRSEISVAGVGVKNQRALTSSVLSLGLGLGQLGPRGVGGVLSVLEVVPKPLRVDGDLILVGVKVGLYVGEQPGGIDVHGVRSSAIASAASGDSERSSTSLSTLRQHPPKHVPLSLKRSHPLPLSLDLLLKLEDQLMSLLHRPILDVPPPSSILLLTPLHLRAHLPRNPQQLLVLQLQFVDARKGDEMSRNDRVGSRIRLGASNDGGFLLVEIVGRVVGGNGTLSSGDGAREGANLTPEVAQLMAKDRVFAFEAVDIEAVGSGLTRGKVAVGDGLGELGGEGGGFDGEALVLDALLLE